MFREVCGNFRMQCHDFSRREPSRKCTIRNHPCLLKNSQLHALAVAHWASMTSHSASQRDQIPEPACSILANMPFFNRQNGLNICLAALSERIDALFPRTWYTISHYRAYYPDALPSYGRSALPARLNLMRELVRAAIAAGGTVLLCVGDSSPTSPTVKLIAAKRSLS